MPPAPLSRCVASFDVAAALSAAQAALAAASPNHHFSIAGVERSARGSGSGATRLHVASSTAAHLRIRVPDESAARLTTGARVGAAVSVEHVVSSVPLDATIIVQHGAAPNDGSAGGAGCAGGSSGSGASGAGPDFAAQVSAATASP